MYMSNQMYVPIICVLAFYFYHAVHERDLFQNAYDEDAPIAQGHVLWDLSESASGKK
jgi:hypothetical protein